MSMKKCMVWALVLATLCLTFGLCACGGGDDGREYTFTVSGKTLAIGASEDSVTALGTPVNYSESAACGGIEGKDKIYVFNGFRVSTTPSASGNVICRIELTDDSVKTPEGLTIGSSLADVKNAMGNGETVGENLVYSGKTMKLTFVIRDGVVTNIQYSEK